MWFTEWSGNQIGSINTSTGKITRVRDPDASNSVPEGITLGSDGNVWFTESLGNKIGMFDPTSNTFTEHPLPTAGAQPYGITTGPDGNLYFTEYTGNQIGVYSVQIPSFSNSITIPTSNTEPTEIASASLMANSGSRRARPTRWRCSTPPPGQSPKYATPAAQSGPRGIAAASDGSIWFAELNSGKVATIAPSLQIVVTSSPPASMKLGETFGLTVAVDFDSGERRHRL